MININSQEKLYSYDADRSIKENMKIQNITELDKKKKKISLDNGECFALYHGEVRKYQLMDGMELKDSVYEEIIHEVLEKRARERMLYLLKDSDKTEKQIREKLESGYYPQSTIEAAVAFGKKYHYIDDERYAENFLQGRRKQSSRKELEYKLLQKGISKDICRKLYESMGDGESQEEEAIERLLCKKNVDFSSITREERQKIYAYLMRKGFSYDTILKKVNEFETRDT